MLIAGPAVAGLITAATGGLQVCYLVDTISFAAALYGIAGLPAMPPQEGTTRPGPRAVAEGVGFIARRQVLAGAFLTDLSATVFGLPVALFPAINAERFGGSASTLGLLTAAIGVGGLVSSVWRPGGGGRSDRDQRGPASLHGVPAAVRRGGPARGRCGRGGHFRLMVLAAWPGRG